MNVDNPIWCSLAAALVLCAAPEPGPAQERLEGLSAYIEESLADWDLPGIAVAVVHDDELIFARGFGVKEVGRDDPVDADTRFQIGSTTKAFAAAAIGHWSTTVSSAGTIPS